MRWVRSAAMAASWLVVVGAGVTTVSSDASSRTELKRAELSGAAGMEVISSVSVYAIGEELPRHFHHGIETGYVLEGALVQFPGKPPVMLETGTAILNLRDVPHGGFKVVGTGPLKLFTVHVVDKDKPLYEWVN
jgi:quercetin dioxygenase-like cupin family protein